MRREEPARKSKHVAPRGRHKGPAPELGRDQLAQRFSGVPLATATTTVMASEPLQPSTSTSPAEDKNFQSWRRKFSLLTGLGLSEEDKAERVMDAHRNQCEKWKFELLHYSQC